jgi:hypothetical protein
MVLVLVFEGSWVEDALLGQREIGHLGCNHASFLEKEEEKEEKRVGGEWQAIKCGEEKNTKQQ